MMLREVGLFGRGFMYLLYVHSDKNGWLSLHQSGVKVEALSAPGMFEVSALVF